MQVGRRKFIQKGLALGLGMFGFPFLRKACAYTGKMTRSTARKPNVLVFFTDQQRWDTVGCYGNPLGLTPNLDEMAGRGTRLDRAFTVQPVCGPARACLVTGKYATETGCWRNSLALPGDVPTTARAFRAAGYSANYIGKWHLANAKCEGATLGKQEPVPPEKRGGFDDYWLAADVLEFFSAPYQLRLMDQDGKTVERAGYRVDAQTDIVIEFLEREAKQRERPFFLTVSYLEPHFQNDVDEFVAPNGYAEEIAKRIWVPPDLAALGGSTKHHLPGYYGCVKSLDENLGRVLRFLSKTGLDNDTVVLFCTDHGCHFKTRNGEYKRSCHESSIRVPAVFQGPGFDRGAVVHELTSLLDWPATLLDSAELPPLPGQRGRSVLPLLHGRGTDWPKDVLVQISESQVGRAVRTDRWKFGVDAPGRNGWDEPASDSYVEEYLYDLEKDPYELNNLAGQEGTRDTTNKLATILKRRMVEAGEKEPDIRC
jgi:arylsulfatase A-like enzyme